LIRKSCRSLCIAWIGFAAAIANTSFIVYMNIVPRFGYGWPKLYLGTGDMVLNGRQHRTFYLEGLLTNIAVGVLFVAPPVCVMVWAIAAYNRSKREASK